MYSAITLIKFKHYLRLFTKRIIRNILSYLDLILKNEKRAKLELQSLVVERQKPIKKKPEKIY